MISIDDMHAQWACERLVRLFAQLNDQGDYDGIAALFTEDATFARPIAPDTPVVGREAIRAMFRDRQPRRSQHVLTNTVIDLKGPTQAAGRSYLIFLSTTDMQASLPAPAEPGVVFGHFDDTFRLEDGEWRFSSRRGALSLIVGGAA